MKAEEIEDRRIVVIEAPEFFKGKEIALTIGRCKHHHNAVRCYLFNPDAATKEVCVSLSKDGDSLVYLTDINPTD